MKHVKCYIKNYPRPQFVRAGWQSLNGAWDFLFDDANEGEDKEFYKNFPAKAKEITVPFSYLCEKSGIGDMSRHDFIWYRRTVRIDAKRLQERINLIFEGCDYTTKVWVNGSFAGSHKGGYTRFIFDITLLLKSGDNEIVVKAEDSFDTSQPRGKQRWQPKNFGCWYEETTGIYKTVWLEFCGKTIIEDAEIIPKYDEQSVEFVFSVPDGKGLFVYATAELYGQKAAEGSIRINSAHTRLTLSLSTGTAEWETESWSPHKPALYDLTFTLTDADGNILDTVQSYFGFRRFDISSDRIRLNYSPLYLKMILDQGYWPDSHLTPPDEEAIEKDIRLILDAGFNGIRKHQKIEDERFYYYCDIMGVIVWCEMPSHYSFNETSAGNMASEWSSIVKQMRNHPSIMTWVPFNESWGIKNVRSDKTQQAFTESIYFLTKTLDSQKRSVISNDGWEHTRSDIITIHNYEQYGEDLTAAYGDKNTALSDMEVSGRSPRAVFAEGYRYSGQPVMISEYGGIAFAKDKGVGWGYGEMVKDEAAYLCRLESLTDSIKALPYVCGYCLTQATDLMQELNGIYDMRRAPKVAIDEIKRINTKPCLISRI